MKLAICVDAAFERTGFLQEGKVYEIVHEFRCSHVAKEFGDQVVVAGAAPAFSPLCRCAEPYHKGFWRGRFRFLNDPDLGGEETTDEQERTIPA